MSDGDIVGWFSCLMCPDPRMMVNFSPLVDGMAAQQANAYGGPRGPDTWLEHQARETLKDDLLALGRPDLHLAAWLALAAVLALLRAAL